MTKVNQICFEGASNLPLSYPKLAPMQTKLFLYGAEVGCQCDSCNLVTLTTNFHPI